jgi:hypothetical protein
MAYLGKTPSQAVRSRYYFTASGSETSLSPSEVTGLSFTDANYVDVSLNGVALVSGTDYTATPSTNTISGLAALTASDVVEIVVYDTFSVFGGSVKGDFNIDGGNLTLGDNDRAIFGDGSDLQIYHDTTANHSYITESGSGDLVIQGNNVRLENTSGNYYVRTFSGGAVQLYHNNSEKLATTSSGIDVTGTVTADGLTVDNAGVVRINPSSGDDFLTIQQGGSQAVITADSAAGAGNLVFRTTSAGSDTDTMLLAANGDISFYADDGTTQGFFWDASTQRLGLGTTGPNAKIEAYEAAAGTNSIIRTTVNGASGGDPYIRYSVSGVLDWSTGVDNSDSDKFKISKGTTLGTDDYLTITSGGDVGIADASPQDTLHVGGTGTTGIKIGTQGSTGRARIFVDSGNDYALTVDTQNVSDALVINRTTGAVGIGTDSPSEELTVSKSDDARISITSSGTGKAAMTGLLEFDGSDGRHGYIGPVGGVMRLNTDGGYDILFQPGGTEKVRFTSTGLVGIGTSSPSTYSAGGSNLVVANSNSGANAVGMSLVNPNAAVGTSVSLDFVPNTNIALASISSPRTAANGATDLAFNTYTGSSMTEKMRITSGGDVGIGTTSPGGELEVYRAGTSEVLIGTDNGGTAQLTLYEGDDSTKEGLLKYDGVNNRIHLATSSAPNALVIPRATGDVIVGKTTTSVGDVGVRLTATTGNANNFTMSLGTPMQINRTGDDGGLINFLQDTSAEGSISVSGTTVSYNGGHLSRWSQATDGNRIDGLVKGTVMTNLDQMAEWTKDGVTEDNEQLNCMAVSSVEGDANVAGVFVNWDDEDPDYTADMNVAMTGDMVIRIAQGTTVARGDLLMSAGDGTAKPQGDDIVRSKTIANVTSTTVSHTYDDGSYLVPCVLMAC